MSKEQEFVAPRELEPEVQAFRDQREKLARKLLDLSARNPLIHTNLRAGSRNAATSRLRFVGSTLEEVFAGVTGEKAIGFDPVPKPKELPEDEETEGFNRALEDARAIDIEYQQELADLDQDAPERAAEAIERRLRDRVRDQLGLPVLGQIFAPGIEDAAKAAGVNPSYDMSRFDWEKRERVRGTERLKALKYPEDLDGSLRLIFGQAKLRESETGVNFLSLAMGYLEWYASDSSEKAVLSPIILCQVRMTRKRKDDKIEFEIKGEEEPLVNLCLKEKLKIDFGIDLPELEENAKVEDYFQSVQKLIDGKANWRIKRYCVLGFYSFAKLVMHKDLLNPAWDFALEENGVIGELFGNATIPDTGLSETYEIDTPKVRSKVPTLPLEADSSQVSAIVDILDGNNLALQGPPGTGKSQTIANLIAAAIYHGKKVLFVAEKNAALRVVKDRLDRLGLGELCLELHSAKTNKADIAAKLVQQVDQRQRARTTQTPNFEKLFATIDSLNKRADGMNKSDFVGTPLFGLIGKILTIQARVSDLARISAKISFRAEDVADDIKTKVIQQTLREVKPLADKLLSDGMQLMEHPWIKLSPLCEGIETKNLTDDFLEVLKNFDVLEKIIKDSLLFNNESAPATLAELKLLVRAAETTDLRAPNSRLLEIIRINENIAVADGYIRGLRSIESVRQQIQSTFRLNVDRAESFELDRVRQCANRLNVMGYGDKNLGDVGTRQASIDKSVIALSQAADILDEQGKLLSIPRLALDLSALKALSHATRLAEEFFAKGIESDLGLEALSQPGMNRRVQQAKRQADLLRDARKELKNHFNLPATPAPDRVDSISRELARLGHFWLFSSSARDAVERLNSFRNVRSWPGSTRLVVKLNDLAEYKRQIESFNENQALHEVIESGWQGIDSDFEGLYEAAKWCSEVTETMPQTDFGQALQKVLFSKSAELRKHLAALKDSATFSSVPRSVELLESRVDLTDKSVGELKTTLLAENALLNEAGGIMGALGYPIDLSLNKLESLCDLLQKILDSRGDAEKWFNLCRGGGVDEFEMKSPEVIESFKNYVSKVRAMEIPVERRIALLEKEGPSMFQTLRGALMRDAISVTNVFLFCDRNERFLNLLFHNFKNSPVLSLKAAVASAASTAGRAETAFEYLRRRGEFEKKLGTNIFHAPEENRGLWNHIDDTVQYFAASQLLEAGFGLAEVDARPGKAESMVAELKHFDAQAAVDFCAAIKSRGHSTTVPPGINAPKVEDKTEMVQLRHQSNLQRRHLEIRKLMEKSGRAIQAIRPCFMMSPLSVSTFLPHNQVFFDLVVMDEASQIKVEDGIGSILRGAQVAVVGDQMQLPPTSFFWQGSGTEDPLDEDHEDQTEGYESILDFAWSRLAKRRQLNWHYRSKHHSLIAFSNLQFYDNRLLVSPAPFESGDEVGVKYIYVENHLYEGRKNLPEAQVVLERVLDHVRKRSERSLGVVAINSTQSTLLDEMLYTAEGKYPELKAFRDKWDEKQEGLFIKNLENVQGDERDVIIISTVYGNDAKGSFYQRFGPINGRSGHRRLNVLFTRARYSTVLVTSIDFRKIMANEGSTWGLRALRDYLEFASTGALKGQDERSSGRLPGSEFEVFVMDRLRKEGYETEPQFGVAGFFIDIAVHNKSNPGIFLCGIECDGAPYHSMRSARDRDKLREQILRGLGWAIFRIWSTDWFADEEKEFSKLKAFLHVRQHILAER